VDWSDYAPYVPQVAQPLHEVSRREARAAFKVVTDLSLTSATP
jgi:hypothetical protein